MDKQAKKELTRRGKAERKAAAEAEWQERMVLEREWLKGLLDYLDRELPEAGCDDTLRLARRWAADHGVDAQRLEDSVLHFDGGCDCEVLADFDPETQVDGWPSYVARFGAG